MLTHVHRKRALVLLAAAALAACSSASTAGLPKGPDLLKQAAQAVTEISSVHVSLKFDGAPTSLQLTSAEGDISRDGQAQGSLVIAGTEFPFRLVSGTFYLKPPIGGWVHSPPPYDPTELLDADKGLPSVLTKATAAQTKGEESVGGTGAYKVEATIPTDLVSELADLAPGQQTLTATMWIAKEGSRLLKFRVPFRSPGADKDTVITGTLTNFGLKFTVKPPA